MATPSPVGWSTTTQRNYPGSSGARPGTWRPRSVPPTSGKSCTATPWWSSRAGDRRVRMGEPRLWLVTLTVGGPPYTAGEVKAALDRLAVEQPFLLEGRFAPNRVELRYWEEAAECTDACALALRLWGEHRQSAGLPAWTVLGLEVLDRGVAQTRSREA